MRAWLAHRFQALRCTLRMPVGRTLTWWSRHGQLWVAIECDHCGEVRNPKPVAGLRVTPERVPFERQRMLYWYGGGF